MNTKQGHPVLLFLILAAHLLAFWIVARHQLTVRVPTVQQKERITYLSLITPPPARLPTLPAVPHKQATPAAPRSRIIAAPSAVTAPAQQAVTPVAPAIVAPAPAPAPESHHLSTAEILEQAHNDMPRIERELRNNVPTRLTLSKDSLRYKLEHGIENAYVGGDQRVTVDFYTSPDNVHYMRFTKAGKIWCTMHGGPVSLASAMGHDQGDSKVNCPPTDSGWKDMPYVN